MKPAIALFCVFLAALTAPRQGVAQLQSNQTRITVDSNPSGAAIWNADGSEMGVAPIVVLWTLPLGQATAVSAPLIARWVSGAAASVRLKLTGGLVQSHTINRPHVPGLEADVIWARQMRQQQQEEQQQAQQEPPSQRPQQSSQESNSNSSGLADILNAFGQARYGTRNAARSSSSSFDDIKVSPTQPVGGGFLVNQSTSGSNKYCRYGNGKVLTIGVLEFCPSRHD